MSEHKRNQASQTHISVKAGDEREGAATAVSTPNNAPDTTDWKDKYLRLAAENENSRKRLERSYAQRVQQAQEALLRDILPLADNLEHALAHKHNEETADIAALRAGIAATLRQLQQTLARYGVQPIPAEGRPFDPEQHEAIAVAPYPALPVHTVMRVEQTGYTIQDKLLRPARVVVTGG